MTDSPRCPSCGETTGLTIESWGRISDDMTDTSRRAFYAVGDGIYQLLDAAQETRDDKLNAMARQLREQLSAIRAHLDATAPGWD